MLAWDSHSVSSQRHAGRCAGTSPRYGAAEIYVQDFMSPSTIHSARRIYKVASIPADGIGPEVISAAIQVLNKLAIVHGGFEFHFDHFDWSSDLYKKTGRYIPDGGLDSLKKYDAILFGAVGDRGSSTSLAY